MDLESPTGWRWIWLVVAVIFAISEMVAPATFFFLPFAIGAVVAAALAFLHASVGVTWIVFTITSIVSFSSLWRLGRKLEQVDEEQEGVGATRWIGQEATVTKTIGPDGNIGQVRLERESWRAESLSGAPIRNGSRVLIARLAGTRLVVVPVEEPEDGVDLTTIDPGKE